MTEVVQREITMERHITKEELEKVIEEFYAVLIEADKSGKTEEHDFAMNGVDINFILYSMDMMKKAVGFYDTSDLTKLYNDCYDYIKEGKDKTLSVKIGK